MSRVLIVVGFVVVAAGAVGARAQSYSSWRETSTPSQRLTAYGLTPARPSYSSGSSSSSSYSYSSPSNSSSGYSSYSNSYSSPSSYQYPSQPTDWSKVARGGRGLILIVGFVLGLVIKLIGGVCRMFRR